MAQPTGGQSQPSVKTMQFETTLVSPPAKRAKMAARSGIGVSPSRGSVLTGAQELLTDGDRMRHVHGKRDGPAVLAVPMRVLDDAAD